MVKITLNNPVVRYAVLRSALTPEQIESRQAEFVISTEAPDTYGTVFKLSGWQLDRYNDNPVVGYNHKLGYGNSDPDNVIGTSEVFIDGEQLIGRVTFEPAEVNPKAEKIFQKVQRGTLRMASIGATPVRGHWGDDKLGEDKDLIYFDETILREWCIVDIGSNPEALKRSDEAMDAIRAELDKEKVITGETPEEIQRSIRERDLIINQMSY